MLNVWPRIIVATLPNGGFGGAGGSSRIVDASLIRSYLQKSGFEVEIIPIDMLMFSDLTFNDLIVYTSSDEPNIRAYIKDVIYRVSLRSTIVPNFDALMAHENKGYQELIRYELNIGNLSGVYVFDRDSFPKKYPYVFKSVTGAGSRNVHLVRHKVDRKRVIRKYFTVSLLRRLILLARKFHYNSREFELYSYRHRGYSLGVVQEFVPGLLGDYKILVFGSKYYGLHREVRKGDFRASGSGKLSFKNIPFNVLDFSRDIFNKLNVPFVSLDVAMTEDSCRLIEYQVLNFGPYTLKKSPGYYLAGQEKGEWVYFEEESCLEEEFARSLVEFIRLHYQDRIEV